jgi:hypothetical protein
MQSKLQAYQRLYSKHNIFTELLHSQLAELQKNLIDLKVNKYPFTFS